MPITFTFLRRRAQDLICSGSYPFFGGGVVELCWMKRKIYVYSISFSGPTRGWYGSITIIYPYAAAGMLSKSTLYTLLIQSFLSIFHRQCLHHSFPSWQSTLNLMSIYIRESILMPSNNSMKKALWGSQSKEYQPVEKRWSLQPGSIIFFL